MVTYLVDTMQIRDIAAQWSNETGNPARVYIQALRQFKASRKSDDVGYELALSLVNSSANLTRDELERFCKENEIEKPKFWFGTKVSLASKESECRKFLTDEVRKNKRMPKKDYRALAKETIEGLTDRAFDRAWKKNSATGVDACRPP